MGRFFNEKSVRKLRGDKLRTAVYLANLNEYPARFTAMEVADALGIKPVSMAGKLDDLALELPWVTREKITNKVYYNIRRPYDHELGF